MTLPSFLRSEGAGGVVHDRADDRRSDQRCGYRVQKALIEASLNAELSHHLGYAPGAEKPDQTTNHRNGSTSKTVLTGDGKVLIETPRDREGSFEPQLLPKHARRFTAFDDSIVALYARGLTVREIQSYLIETYGTEVSPQLISTVTDAVLAEVTAWQSRPLEAVYAVVFFDALRVKIREDNVVRNKAVYLALGYVGTARARSSACGSRPPRVRSSG